MMLDDYEKIGNTNVNKHSAIKHFQKNYLKPYLIYYLF